MIGKTEITYRRIVYIYTHIFPVVGFKAVWLDIVQHNPTLHPYRSIRSTDNQERISLIVSTREKGNLFHFRPSVYNPFFIPLEAVLYKFP